MTSDAASPQSATKRGPSTRVLAAVSLVVVLAAGAFALAAVRRHNQNAAADLRPTGIPATVSTNTANLMGLGPVPPSPAPAFTLTDQRGATLSLAHFRGHPIVLEFMDPHCTDICPIVSQEFVDAYHDLGPLGRNVVFLAVNVNRWHLRVADVSAFSREHQLDTIPTWHFFTGSFPALRKVWHDYNIAVQSRGKNADVLHSSIVYFISPTGQERYLASPQADHTKSGKSYLPMPQLTSWGQGIADVARSLAS